MKLKHTDKKKLAREIEDDAKEGKDDKDRSGSNDPKELENIEAPGAARLEGGQVGEAQAVDANAASPHEPIARLMRAHLLHVTWLWLWRPLVFSQWSSCAVVVWSILVVYVTFVYRFAMCQILYYPVSFDLKSRLPPWAQEPLVLLRPGGLFTGIGTPKTLAAAPR